ncbi:hypothetical protein ISS30_06240, partial [bacterium]|nr:hypothetical protein [bacterium]
MHTTEQSTVHRSPFTVNCKLSTVNYFQEKPACAGGAPPSMKIGLLAGGDACQHSSWWCHASPHDTKTLLLLCMVSTA